MEDPDTTAAAREAQLVARRSVVAALGAALDHAYVEYWAGELGLGDEWNAVSALTRG
jgi:hypothetical protein